ncbi:acyl-CoA dehydrogenase [Candidatus Puniceispirillum sp.]|nr:acyl-CoA dehydrogenase [Candidatus Puniceispirillum sp.]
MDFELTTEQQIFYDTVNRFAANELADGAVKRANSDGYPWDIAKRFAEMGLLGITIPESKGGIGGTLTDAILAIQAIAEFCPRSADVVQAGNFGAIRTFAEYASDAQLKRYLPELLAGEGVMSVGMSEPDAGSSVTELKTFATPDGDDFIVNGSKVFGTNSVEAKVFLIYLRFGPGTEGIGSAIIERGTSGFEIGPSYRYMNGEFWSPLYFEECRIPKANILLGSGGFKKQISGFNIERLGNAARAVAVGRKAFLEAREHAKTRQQFGRDICEFQGLQWKFAEMQMRLESAQLLLMRAVTRADNNLPSAHDSALAKLACNDAGFFAANEALQVMGALGFSDDNIVQYCLRRTRGWMIAGGSTEILKNRIAEGIFERRFSQRPKKSVKEKT